MIHHETESFADIAMPDQEKLVEHELGIIGVEMQRNIERQVNGLRADGCMFDEDEVRRLHQERYITHLELFAGAVRKRREEFYGTPQTI